MGKIVSMEEGIDTLVDFIGKLQKRPILIAVYGASDRGKSELMDRVKERLPEMKIVGYGGAPRAYVFEQMQDNPHFEVHLFHCKWGRPKDTIMLAHVDPNFLARRFGTSIDLNVGIYNPKMGSHGLHDPESNQSLYDLVIENPDSVPKPPLDIS